MPFFLSLFSNHFFCIPVPTCFCFSFSKHNHVFRSICSYRRVSVWRPSQRYLRQTSCNFSTFWISCLLNLIIVFNLHEIGFSYSGVWLILMFGLGFSIFIFSFWVFPQGLVFSPVPFQSEQLVPPAPDNDAEQDGRTTGDNSQRKGLLSAFQGLVNDSLRRLFHPNDVWPLSWLYAYNVFWRLRLLTIYLHM